LKKTVLKSISKVKISKQKLANLAKNAKNVGVGFSKKKLCIKTDNTHFRKKILTKIYAVWQIKGASSQIFAVLLSTQKTI